MDCRCGGPRAPVSSHYRPADTFCVRCGTFFDQAGAPIAIDPLTVRQQANNDVRAAMQRHR